MLLVIQTYWQAFRCLDWAVGYSPILVLWTQLLAFSLNQFGARLALVPWGTLLPLGMLL